VVYLVPPSREAGHHKWSRSREMKPTDAEAHKSTPALAGPHDRCGQPLAGLAWEAVTSTAIHGRPLAGPHRSPRRSIYYAPDTAGSMNLRPATPLSGALKLRFAGACQCVSPEGLLSPFSHTARPRARFSQSWRKEPNSLRPFVGCEETRPRLACGGPRSDGSQHLDCSAWLGKTTTSHTAFWRNRAAGHGCALQGPRNYEWLPSPGWVVASTRATTFEVLSRFTSPRGEARNPPRDFGTEKFVLRAKTCP
jgi:hypothetical protein